MPFVGSVSFHHPFAVRQDIQIIGNPLGIGHIQFLCIAPPSALVYAVIGGVPAPPIFVVTLHAIRRAPVIPPIILHNMMAAAAGVGLFHIWEQREYIIRLLPGQGQFQYTSPRTGQIIVTNTIHIRSQVQSSVQM